VDKVTELALDKGRKNNQLLIQPQYSPMPVGEQVAILYCGTRGLMRDIAIDQVRPFQEAFLDRLRATNKADVLEPLGAGKLTPEIEKILADTAESVILAMK
jgi:F-type H+-transporting ATPase subunit alpha